MDKQLRLMGAAINGVAGAFLEPDAVLRDFPRRAEIMGVKDEAFYSLDLYNELCDYLEGRLGAYAFLSLGRKMASRVIEVAFSPDLGSLDDAMVEIHRAHQLFCKPVEGAFDLVERAPGHLRVRYTAPYNCILQEGLLYEIAIRYGAPLSTITHTMCRRRGAEACFFDIRH